MRILYVSPWFPFPPTNGSELRINALVRGLATKHEVSLISFQRRAISDVGLGEARALCRDVWLVPWQPFNPTSGRALAGFFSSRPRSVIDTHSPIMASMIREQVATGRYDLIVASQLVAGAYASEFGTVPALWEELELATLAQQPEDAATSRQRARRTLMWAKQRAHVRALLPRFAACTVVSENERLLLAKVAPDYDAVAVVPNCLDLTRYSGIETVPRANSLVFTGAFTYSVNHEAMIWFMQRVYPAVRAAVPDLSVIVTGDHNGLPLPHADQVIMTGFVDDIRPLVAGATVSIAPILHGGGTRLKILEAMALGTAVVTTPKGAEGLQVINGEHLLSADSPEAFAAAVIRMLQDSSLRDTIATNGRQLVESTYDWQTMMPRFLRTVEQSANHAKRVV